MDLPTFSTIESYLSGNYHCPFCKDGNIEGGPIEVDGNAAWQDISCTDCKKQWRDEYTLTAISVRPEPKNDQTDTWYSDEAKVIKGMYLHEYQNIIDDHNNQKEGD